MTGSRVKVGILVLMAIQTGISAGYKFGTGDLGLAAVFLIASLFWGIAVILDDL